MGKSQPIKEEESQQEEREENRTRFAAPIRYRTLFGLEHEYVLLRVGGLANTSNITVGFWFDCLQVPGSQIAVRSSSVHHDSQVVLTAKYERHVGGPPTLAANSCSHNKPSASTGETRRRRLGSLCRVMASMQFVS